MPPGQFDALQDEDSSSSEDEGKTAAVSVPSHEDLSMARVDEETVLTAVYGDDFTREDGVWGCACLNVHVRPPDTEREHVGSELTLSVQLGKQYPYVVPKIKFRNVTGLSKGEQRELVKQVEQRAQECAQVGSVMMCELVQVVEDYLLAHNRDPNMSEWEHMKAREALQQQEEEQAKRDREKELKRIMMETHDKTEEYSQDRIQASGGEVEKELARQMEALAEADRKRRGFATLSSNDESNDEADVDSEFDDADDDDDVYPTITGGSSRYQSDFIEMGVLGRGGGGEVVKVRNRLDRRLYAIKKIELESEEGTFASVAAIQNKKLRREVTTISRMLHKNIVRYYQAWVEGGEDVDTSMDEDEKDGGNENAGVTEEEDAESSDEDDETGSGWWTNSPTEGVGGHLLSRGNDTDDFSDQSSDSGSWVPEDDDTVDMSNPRDMPPRHDSHSASIQDLLGHDFQSPLLAGMGFQNQSYHGMFQNKKKPKSSTSQSRSDDDIWEDSGVRIDPTSNNRILYIQMEYCATTLRKLIDESTVKPLDENALWRMVRQMLEALVYIHGQNIIHRDLKPSNVFLDSEGNVRLGDFGLATRHRAAGDSVVEEEESGAGIIYDAIEDISGLLGGSQHTNTRDSTLSAGESLTGGVGTTFYRAPEQEHALTKHRGTYGVQADLFSLGIILFEMFHPPFETYMERAQTLSVLRGDTASPEHREEWLKRKTDWNSDDSAWKEQASQRFPESFLQLAPESAQRMILWCLERVPDRRPSAEELLTSELLPRKMELEQRYLEEALQTLTNPQSDCYQQILGCLFARPTPDLIEVTYDTDAAVKANNLGAVGQTLVQGHKRILPPSEGLMRAISDIRATGGMNVESLTSLAMSSSSLVSATSALRRARNAGKVGKGGKGLMKRSTQRAAGILAMNAASSAAVSGAADGVHGADPRVVEEICNRLCELFEAHGAVRLRAPLLRPRPTSLSETAVGGPAEVLNSRGTVLLLPEDLTVSFARALGRGGAATSNLKRYDIDRVYHKSVAGGHPRESLEASFDIVHDDPQGNGNQMEAEAFMVVCQAMSNAALMSVSERRTVAVLSEPVTTPLWFFRLTHTRLSDSIMEICGVPQKESAKKACLQIFARCSAPAPGILVKSSHQQPRRKRSTSVSQNIASIESGTPDVKTQIDAAVKSQVLPKNAVKRLEVFLTSGCSPLPANIDDALDTILSAIGNVRLLDAKNQSTEPRRLKRYEDIARIVKSLKHVVQLMETMGVGPLFGSKKQGPNSVASRPLYMALDLGLRQKRKHFNGHLFFQAIVLPDNFFQADATEREGTNRKSILGLGTKVAEGGRYDDLVRRYRPPGNFGTAMINYYTAAPIPRCMGVRFFVGKLVELAYVDAAIAKAEADSSEQWNPNDTGGQAMDILRQSLGHPLSLTNTVQCVITGVHGMDAASAPDRLLVASRLWSEGISAEYMPQSGVMLSLLKRYRESLEPFGDRATEWSLDELFGVCAILKIPFVVIVQHHLLRDKGSVRLRRIACDSLTGASSGSEIFVPLENLASTVALGADEDSEKLDSSRLIQGETELTSRQQTSSSSAPQVECVYVDNDQYYGLKQVSKETSHWKAILKRIKGATQRSEAFLKTLTESQVAAPLEGTPVFAVNILFWELRDFGTCLMKRAEPSAMGAALEVTETYPNHKKVFKTLGMAIDNLLKRCDAWKDSKREVTILLYSTVDDRFDMVTLEGLGGNHSHETTNTDTSARRKSDRR